VTPVLEEAINSICLERDTGWDTSFNAVRSLVEEYGEQQLADRLVDEIPRSMPFEAVADLLNFLIWSTSDNGHAITTAANSWLRKQADTRRILIALNLDVIPFQSEDEAKQILAPIKAKNPIAMPHCARMLDTVAKQKWPS
jgi:hypothetical protein